MSDSAIAEWVSSHRDELYRYIVGKVNCPEAAQDILHDTFIRLMEFVSKGSVYSPRSFLYQVANNLIIDHHRRNLLRPLATEAQLEELATRVADPAPQPAEVLSDLEQMALLQQALRELPPRCREVFILLKFKHYTYAQVEQELQISSTMVFKHMHRALEHCRRRLERV